VSVVSSLVNGLCGIMAVLYGEGDFLKTTGIATAAGYDCDNQAATCAGLMGVMNGAQAIPDELTKNVTWEGAWEKPFNDQYVNATRDGIPIVTPISEIVERIHAVAQEAILANGGRKEMRDGVAVYVIRTD
jgi:hypothetical protein